MSLDAAKNFAKVIVSTGYDAAATSIVLSGSEGAKLPQPSTDGEFNVVWYNSTDYNDPTDDPNVEIVRVTARSTDTLTVTRAQESTSASTKNTGGKTYKMILAVTQKMIEDIDTALPIIAHATVSGTCNGSNVTFTLSATPAHGVVMLVLNGQVQAPTTDYSVSGDTITYVTAPASDLNGLPHYAVIY